MLAGCATTPDTARREAESGWFEADVLTGLGDEGQPRATITVSLPYRRLVFFQQQDGFVSNYRLRAVQRVDGRAVQLREWTGTVFAQDFAETRQPKALRRTVGVDLAPETVGMASAELEIRVEVDGSRRRGRTVVSLTGRAPRTGGLTLGDPALYRQRDRFAEIDVDVEVMPRGMPDPGMFENHERGPFDLSTGPPWVYLRVFDLRAGAPDSVFALTLRVVEDDAGRSRWSRAIEVPRTGSETAVLVRVPGEALAFGPNRLRVSLAGTEGVEIELENRGLDVTDDRSWDANLELIEIIARRDEMQWLEIARDDERAARWREFWDRRDPDSSTALNEGLVEHDRRVAHARAHLRDGFRDGALSDRGRIWILNGPPDSIESSSGGFDSNERFEVWRYRDPGLVYYFRDTDGFGTYRLVWREQVGR